MQAEFATDTATIMQRLKEETKTAHLQLEKLTIPYIKKAQDDASYRRLLSLFYGYLKPVETAIQQQLAGSELLPDLAERRQTAMLAADLQLLGTEAASLPQAGSLPALDSHAAALGALYVLEGSTLGGRIISRMLSAQLGRDAENGIAFFSGYGAETGAKWATFTAALNQYAEAHPQAQDEMVAAADETFSRFRAWIERQ